MTIIIAALLIFAGCASTSRFPGVSPARPTLTWLSVSPDPDFKRGIDTLVADTLFPPSNLGVKIVSARNGEVLYALNPDMLFNPASNQKLVTAATALKRLGPKFPLRTLVFADTTKALLWIKGLGDPLLSTEDMDSLARAVKTKIPAAKPWKIMADVSYFDDLYWGSGWTWDEEPAAYGMFISPLILDNNTVSVEVRPAETPGHAPTVTIFPRTSFMSLENTAVTIADTPITEELQISRKWRERSNVITVQGQLLPSSRPAKEHLSVWKPELYAATVFAEKLGMLGVPVAAVTVDTIQQGGTIVAEYVHTLDTVVTFMNKVSDNLSAEALLKVVAAETYKIPGSAKVGASLARQTLAALGVDTLKISIVDGSGLSRYDLTSASTMVRLLEGMHRDSLAFPTFSYSLPIAGVDGTIDRRMRGTLAAGHLRAKTGSLTAVSALSGYVQTASGELLIFSILMQGFPGSTRSYRQVQDQIGMFMAGWKR
jgi:D-alanyl-D-alanine carboxypeptidase/D-alanyl-D-alanine-endopeptidase (penicillin-binding protein 4)